MINFECQRFVFVTTVNSSGGTEPSCVVREYFIGLYRDDHLHTNNSHQPVQDDCCCCCWALAAAADAVNLETTRVRARFSDLSLSFSAFSFWKCYQNNTFNRITFHIGHWFSSHFVYFKAKKLSKKPEAECNLVFLDPLQSFQVISKMALLTTFWLENQCHHINKKLTKKSSNRNQRSVK